MFSFKSILSFSEPLPTAPDSFTTNVEIAFQEKKMKVIYGAESFDGVLNTGVLRYELCESTGTHSTIYAYQ